MSGVRTLGTILLLSLLLGFCVKGLFLRALDVDWPGLLKARPGRPVPVMKTSRPLPPPKVFEDLRAEPVAPTPRNVPVPRMRTEEPPPASAAPQRPVRAAPVKKRPRVPRLQLLPRGRRAGGEAPAASESVAEPAALRAPSFDGGRRAPSREESVAEPEEAAPAAPRAMTPARSARPVGGAPPVFRQAPAQAGYGAEGDVEEDGE